MFVTTIFSLTSRFETCLSVASRFVVILTYHELVFTFNILSCDNVPPVTPKEGEEEGDGGAEEGGDDGNEEAVPEKLADDDGPKEHIFWRLFYTVFPKLRHGTYVDVCICRWLCSLLPAMLISCLCSYS